MVGCGASVNSFQPRDDCMKPEEKSSQCLQRHLMSSDGLGSNSWRWGYSEISVNWERVDQIAVTKLIHSLTLPA